MAENIENTLKKMAVVLDKVVKKVDELDKRVAKLEMKTLAEKGKEEIKNSQQPQGQTQQSGFGMGGFGTGFLSSLLGSFAGMSLFNLLFNHDVSPHEFAQQAGLSEEDFSQLEEKIDSLSEEISQIDQKLDEIDQNIDNLSDIEPDTGFADFEPDDTGFDFGGFDDMDMI